MAIIKVAIPASVPAVVDDYQAQNAHLSAFINQVNSQAFILTEVATTTVPALKQGCYINHGGTLYVVDSGDEAISGSPSDGNTYIKISVSGDNLVAAFVNDISGYTWNQAYGYLASGTDLILPYLLVKATAAYAKYRMDITNPIHLMNQNLRTTDSPTFASMLLGAVQAVRLGASQLNVNIYSATVTIDAMVVGEIKLVTTDGSGTYYVKTPTTAGTYLVIAAREGAAYGTYLYAHDTNIYSSRVDVGTSKSFFIIRIT